MEMARTSPGIGRTSVVKRSRVSLFFANPVSNAARRSTGSRSLVKDA